MVIRDLKVLGVETEAQTNLSITYRLITSKLGLSIFSYTLYSVSMRASAVGYTNMLLTENAIIFLHYHRLFIIICNIYKRVF